MTGLASPSSLATDLYLPGENGHPAPGRFPTLVSRTPYGKSGDQTSGIFFARHGYAVAIQDVRGSGNSQDEFYPYIHEAVDSYDAVEWADTQSWSNGKGRHVRHLLPRGDAAADGARPETAAAPGDDDAGLRLLELLR